MEGKDDLEVPTSNLEDELDRELEELAAIFTHPPSVVTELDRGGGGITCEGEAVTRLSFEFPGWGIDICQDAKRKGAAVTRHTAMLSLEVPHKSVEKSFGEADKPGNGTFVYGMPNEVWMHILTRLNTRDLCSIMQTCRWLHSLASQDEVWLSFHSPTEEEEEEGNKASDANLPRPAAWSSTPTVYDKGVICFRNQILLRFKIRNALQCGLSWLIGQDALDFASESDVHLLRAVLHILQEVDVADDFTLSSKTHTRAKLKRCFLLNGVARKVLPGRASAIPGQHVYF